MIDESFSGAVVSRMKQDPIVGDGYAIETPKIRGWACTFFTSYDPAFVTGSAIEDDSIQVFVDLEAEWPGWQQHPRAQQFYGAAERLAYQRLSEKIERAMETRRKRWRKR